MSIDTQTDVSVETKQSVPRHDEQKRERGESPGWFRELLRKATGRRKEKESAYNALTDDSEDLHVVLDKGTLSLLRKLADPEAASLDLEDVERHLDEYAELIAADPSDEFFDEVRELTALNVAMKEGLASVAYGVGEERKTVNVVLR